jgi:hypothetical protein
MSSSSVHCSIALDLAMVWKEWEIRPSGHI